MVKNAVRCRDVVVVRGGREVLHGVGFELRAGSVTGLLGPSGCGKTTLIRAIVGLQAKVTGEVAVLGSPAGAAELRGRIGYVTQEPSVYGDLSVSENLRFFASVLGVRSDDVARVIDAVDLGTHADVRVDRLSGGQRSRASLAAALLGEPELLVLDEPTVGLDPVLRRDLWELFHRLADGGATLLVSSHVMDEAVRCDRLLLMRDGELLADDTPQALLEAVGTDDIEQAFLTLIDRKAASR
ncbi:ABC transporter ATP-binding protein [Kribbella sandramycini]|uniref:ABC transporter ATP-binding protein n=1 Tax=Kribbella sandramycini TaxID=60450 RepID=A0A7Y4NZZ6_9ACTN|nr:ABC transporter ATP-binding protein [Kribbella sandramycini]MBB6564906.1 ABC-2 type transport system ATP-binding protein [Kribbella sandramycini]NOL42602.1 ABC transporter ATP-binding protein [Kribbella sandramycini]